MSIYGGGKPNPNLPGSNNRRKVTTSSTRRKCCRARTKVRIEEYSFNVDLQGRVVHYIKKFISKDNSFEKKRKEKKLAATAV
jgi:hypothetical protein